MKKVKLANMLGKQLKIRPMAKRIDYTRGELPPIDFWWRVASASPDKLQLLNPSTSHILNIGTDHVREYRTDPDGSDGFLILKSQVTLRGPEIIVEPLL